VSLETYEDVACHRRAWAVQRAAWLLLVLGVLAAGLGAFGPGPLTRVVAGTAALRAEYPMVGRQHAPLRLAVALGRTADASGAAVRWLSRDYADRVRIDSVTPVPAEVASAGDRLVFRFRHEGPGPLRVLVELTPRGPGSLAGSLGAPEAPSVRLAHWIHP